MIRRGSGRIVRRTTGLLLVALVGSVGSGRADAACNLIPQSQKTFRGTLGSANRPFAIPGDLVELSVRPAVCDAASPGFAADVADQVVTLVFEPRNNGPRRVVVLTSEDCSGVALQAKLATCGGTSGVTSVSCLRVNQGGAPGMVSLIRNGERRLTFRFPDTDSILIPDGDQNTLSGPVSIAVTTNSDPLPCSLATQSCSDQAGLVACIDDLFELDGTCSQEPDPLFSQFMALPRPNDFQAACFSESPPCTALANELRGTLDGAGNLLLPMNWQGILVRSNDVPVPRLLRETLKTPVSITIPSAVFLGSFTPEGGKLPPIFTPQFDPSIATPGVLTLFGSADAPATVLRIARHRGRCVGGANAGLDCAATPDCLGSTCADACVGGANDGLACMADGDCPAGKCGVLFDDTLFAALTAGGGPLVIPRALPQICQMDPHPACSNDGQCSGGSDICVSYALEAQNPVPLEGLTGSEEIFSFVSREAIDLRDRNGDGDILDTVVTLRDKVTGLRQPLGAPAGCGVPGTPEGRAVVSIFQPPFRFPAIASEASTLAFLESESATNFCDVNSDYDHSDSILRVFDIDTGEVTAGMSPSRVLDAEAAIDGHSVVVSNGQAFYRRSEARQGRQLTTRVNVAHPGGAESPNPVFETPSGLSRDGRFVVFESPDPLAANDDASGYDVYVRDRLLQTTTRVSLAPGSTASTGSGEPAISADGRFVAFSSGNTNLVPGHPHPIPIPDVYIHDRLLQTNAIVSVPAGGGQSNDSCFEASVSDDGRIVTFKSWATNLTLTPYNNPNFDTQVYVRDRDTPTVTLVSSRPDGGFPNDESFGATVSGDGNFVVFTSYATDIVPGVTFSNAYLRDLAAGVTELVNVSSNGTHGNGISTAGGVSADGRFVVLASGASNLVPGDTNGVSDVFVRDRLLQTTERVSIATGGTQANASSGDAFGGQSAASISGDGRFVVFESNATNLVPDDSNGRRDVFVHDRLTGSTERLSVATAGGSGNADAAGRPPVISRDGRVVAFSSGATNLVPDDNNAGPDLFVRAVDPTDAASDLTGDGDLDDTVLESLDAVSAVVSTRCPAGIVSVAAGSAAFLRPEAAGTTPNLLGCPSGPLVGGNPDLNGNGTSTDEIVHFAPVGGSVQNLAVAATDVSLSGACVGGSTPGRICAAGVDCLGGTCTPTWIAALVSEAGQAAILNGDGDSTDTVVQVHAAGGGAWSNTAEAADTVEVCGSVVVFLTPESAQGSDRNGDGDLADRVIQVFVPSTGTLLPIGHAAEEFVCGPGLVAFRTSEAAQNHTDLNDDDDSSDYVLQVYDLSRPACLTAAPPPDCLRNSMDTIRPCQLDACDPRQPYRVLPDLVRFLTYECDQGGDVTSGCAAGGTDLNGDIPPFAGNLVLQVFQPSTGITKVIGKVAGSATASGGTRGSGNPLGSGDRSASPSVSGGVVYTTVGRCIETLGGSCTVDADCQAGAFCEAGTCKRDQRVCVNDADCTGVPCRKTSDATIVAASADSDADGIPDHIDNCPYAANADQVDFDQDAVGDTCDRVACGDGIQQTDEACDAADDAACPGLCQVDCTCGILPPTATPTITPTAAPAHDSVILPLKPLTIKVGAVHPVKTKTLKVKVANADVVPVDDASGHTIQLVASDGDCPVGTVVGLPDFDKNLGGAQDSALVPPGKLAKALVTLQIAAAGFMTFDADTPKRCTLQLSVTSPGHGDPAPANNSVPLEINVLDADDPPAMAVHESFVKSLKPLSIVIGATKPSKTKSSQPAVGNADVRPAPDTDLITVAVSDGNCPSGTLGMADYDKKTAGAQNTATVLGGKTASGTLPVTATASAFTTISKKSPTRCIATVTAVGPGGDTDASNGTTKLVIDVYDKHDF